MLVESPVEPDLSPPTGPAASARPGGPPWNGTLFRTDRRGVAVAAALATAVFALAWYRHATFRSSTLDLAVFDQAIWKLAHFQAPQVTTIGWNAFADHLSPVLVLFVPFYWVAATPLWLFAAQGVALGAGYLALGPALDAAGLPKGGRPALMVAYLFSPLLWNAALFDFHPTTLAMPFLLAGITAALTDRRRALVACCAALLLLRDDLGPAVTVLALIGALRPAVRASGGLRLRLVVAATGVAWTAFGSVLGKAFGADRHWNYHYGYLGDSATDALLNPVRTAWRLATAVFSGENVFLAVAFLAPLALLPLLKPKWALAVAGLMLPLLASAGPQFHSPKFHYGAVVLPFLIVAAGAALAQVPERLRRPHATGLLLGTSLIGFFVLGPPSTGILTQTAPDPSGARAALQLIDPSDGVAAGTSMGPHLAERDVLIMYPYPFLAIDPKIPLSATARRVDATTAAQIDVVVLMAPGNEESQRIHDGFVASPHARDFRLQGQFGDILLYRRAGN